MVTQIGTAETKIPQLCIYKDTEMCDKRGWGFWAYYWEKNYFSKVVEFREPEINTAELLVP